MNIKSTFDNEASEYEFTSRAVNIYFDEALDELVNNIKFDKNQHLKVLDVCCGTGILTEKVAKVFSNANFTGVDFSTGMVEIARQRLINYNCQFVIFDICDKNKMANLGQFDLIISSFGIHNVHGLKNKQIALNNIKMHLKKGGQYITCDLIKGENKNQIEHYYQFQKDWLLKTYSLKEAEEWMKLLDEEDDPETLANNFKLLENAGLKDLKLFWQKEFLGIWGGIK